MNEASVRNARQKWSEACNLWIYLLCEQWEIDGRNGYWIGDKVGGVWDMDGVVIMGMDDIIYAVEHSVPMEAYDEWRNYCMDISELKRNDMLFELGNFNLPRNIYNICLDNRYWRYSRLRNLFLRFTMHYFPNLILYWGKERNIFTLDNPF